VEKTFFGGQSDSDESVVHKKSDAYDQWIASSAGIEASKKLSAVDRIRGIKPPEPGSFTAGMHLENPPAINGHSLKHKVSSGAKNLVSSLKMSRVHKEPNVTKAPARSDVGGSNKSFTEEADKNSEWDEINNKEWTDLPFELQAADAVMHVVSGILADDATELHGISLDYIEHLVKGGKTTFNDDPLLVIRHTKDAIREMASRISRFITSMHLILDDDEDMALMNLSRLITHPHRFIKPISKEQLEEESDEPELILEAHLQTGLTLQNMLDLVKGQIDTVTDLVDQKLDSARNRILLLNTVVATLTFW
jgi:hypothetical protein